MNICVINGSPKGQNSVTLQTVFYIEKHFPDDVFNIIDVGQKIRAMENDSMKLNAAIDAMLESDLILFSYPVYTFIATAQLHRFIELVKLSERAPLLAGKKATQLTTSKHFYDVTAHRYVNDNCGDLGVLTFPGLSADMDDLLEAKGRAQALSFWRSVHFAGENGLFRADRCKPATKIPTYNKTITEALSVKSDKYDVVIVTNMSDGDKSLEAMISDFRKIWKYKSRVVNINEFAFSGGCLGCFNCASSGKCIYKDGFDSFLRSKIQSADAIIYAVKISDHSMGARFKLYDDRQFCNGHRTVTMGMPFGYIMSGDYENESNLRTIVEGRCEVGGNYLAGVATDEYDTFERLDALAKSLEFALNEKLSLPANFYGVGGMKIFRDLIYVMRGLMKEDHRFYKQHGFYDDLPQKSFDRIVAMKLVGSLMSLPGSSKISAQAMTQGMLMPYKSAIKKDKK